MDTRTEKWWLTILGTLPLFVYANALFNSFTYDDFTYILNNPAVTNASLRSVFEPSRASNAFRPLTFASFALNWEVASIHALSYHVINVLLHAGITVLLYFLLCKLLEEVAGSQTISLVAALLFAVHPIHTEAVASIVGRSELLVTGLLLLGWLLHLEDKWIPAGLCFIVALLAKESAVVFLPLVLVADFARGKLKPARRYILLGAVTAAYLVLLWTAQGGRFGEAQTDALDNPLIGLPPHLRILNALRVAWKYVGLLLFPARLSYDYSYNAIPLYTTWNHLLPAAIGAAVVIAGWLWTVRVRRTQWAVAGALYLVGFTATANIVMPTGTIMGERLAYLPSAGFCLLAALLWVRLESYAPRAGWALLVIMLVALSSRTMVRNRDWSSNYTLYTAAAKVVPNDARMHGNLGGLYLNSGQLDLARQELEAALRIYAPFPEVLEMYGLVEARSGHDEKALEYLERSLAITRKESPSYQERTVNLAAMLVKEQKDEDALRLLQQVVKEQPGNSRVWSNRAVVYYRRGDLSAARSDAEQALQLDPGNLQARSLLEALNRAPPG